MRHPLLLVTLVSTLTTTACAPTRPVLTPGPRDDAFHTTVQTADVLATSGCYLPLADALAAYNAALEVRDDADVRLRAFQTAVLLAVRERAIGLYPGHFQGAPEQLAATLPASATADALEVFALTNWRRGVLPPGASLPFEESRRRAAARYAALEPQAASSTFAATLVVTLLMHHPHATLPADVPLGRARIEPLSGDTAPWAEPHRDQPGFAFAWLLAERTTSVDEWQAWHEAHPDCVEALVPMGDTYLALRRLASADRTLSEALDVLPALVPARAMRGEIRLQLADYETARQLFLDVLTRVPDHREARLGELEALSNLGRHDAALAAADAMLAGKVGYLGETHYWRAWNLLHLTRLTEARAALDEAVRLLFSADVHYLGGLIAFRQEQWDHARAEFTRTIEVQQEHCDAHFTLASVALMQRTWSEAASGFTSAADCFRARVPALEGAIREVEAADLPDALKTGLRERRSETLAANLRQERWAVYNQAVALANSGDAPRARQLAAEVAALGGEPGTAAGDLLIQLGPP